MCLCTPPFWLEVLCVELLDSVNTSQLGFSAFLLIYFGSYTELGYIFLNSLSSEGNSNSLVSGATLTAFDS